MKEIQNSIIAFVLGIVAGLLMCLPKYPGFAALGGFLAAFLLQNLRLAKVNWELLAAKSSLQSVTQMSQNAVVEIDSLKAQLDARRA